MDEYKRVYVVEALGYTDGSMAAAFSDPEDASAYVTRQNDRVRALGGNVVFRTVAVVPLDLPREEW